MGKLLCWLGLHDWRYQGNRDEYLWWRRFPIVYKRYRCSRCQWEKEEGKL